MKILAIMQNQWLHNADKVENDIERMRLYRGDAYAEKYRRRLISYALFAGCKSGRVLKKVFGEQLCNDIIWEEASRKIGRKSSDAFPADTEHLRAVITTELPNVIITFGEIARKGIEQTEILYPPDREAIRLSGQVIIAAPHPAARQPDTMEKLRVAHASLVAAMNSFAP